MREMNTLAFYALEMQLKLCDHSYPDTSKASSNAVNAVAVCAVTCASDPFWFQTLKHTNYHEPAWTFVGRFRRLTAPSSADVLEDTARFLQPAIGASWSQDVPDDWPRISEYWSRVFRRGSRPRLGQWRVP